MGRPRTFIQSKFQQKLLSVGSRSSLSHSLPLPSVQRLIFDKSAGLMFRNKFIEREREREDKASEIYTDNDR